MCYGRLPGFLGMMTYIKVLYNEVCQLWIQKLALQLLVTVRNVDIVKSVGPIALGNETRFYPVSIFSPIIVLSVMLVSTSLEEHDRID